MKKLLLLLALIPTFVNAQKFELTSKGFVDLENHEKDYIVFKFNGKKQKEIYNLALEAISKYSTSPKDKLTKEEPTRLILNGIIPNVTYISRLGIKLYFDMYYNMIFEFKDGKMKVNGLDSIKIVRDDKLNDVQYVFLTQSQMKSGQVIADKYIFDKYGKVNNQKYKDHVELSVNDLVSSIVSLMKKETSSDW